ncbi:MAG: formylglycine-generating enzyme family protein [Planctomycetes bacterium]|nr:formylglycine-generating enzyme family protein [Planctomycetota bacterium]
MKLLKKEPADILPMALKACESADLEIAGRAKEVVEVLKARKSDSQMKNQVKLRWAIATRQSARDAAMLGDLIALLENDDIVVRQLAGLALFRLTGQDFGYEACAGPNQRSQAARKARDWWEKNKTGFEIKAFHGPQDELALDLGNNVTMKLILIPPGRFTMGNPENEPIRDNEDARNNDKGPRREVTISKPFYMGIYEVTQAQYEAVMGEKNPNHYFENPAKPENCVTWNEAVKFCEKLSQKTGKAVRLPTEAEWEYACRAGSNTRFCYGDGYEELGDYAWYRKNSEAELHPVGRKKANAWGLHDMHGNVREWCADWYAISYADEKTENPQGPDDGAERVVRGGSWGGNEIVCRSATRHKMQPQVRNSVIGFRVVVDLK